MGYEPVPDSPRMGIVTAVWLVPLFALLVVCAVLVLLRRRAGANPAESARRRYWWSVLVLVAMITVVRVGICWWAAYMAFRHTESLSEIPVIALEMPEYMLTPGDPSTPEGMWALTGTLVIGTSVGVSVLALVVWGFARRAPS